MSVDFLQQLFYAGLFFFWMAGVGYFLLHTFEYTHTNLLLSLGLAYFTSLCLYTTLVVVGLFILPDKRMTLLVSTLVYGALSFGILGFLASKESERVKSYSIQYKVQIITTSIVLGLTSFLFFLQIYHTAILDEWLHRPVIQSFVDNGIFPLANPLDPGSDYIRTYHYGTQVIAAALQLVFRLDVPASLDLLKLSYFIGTFFLFFGLILAWTKKWYLSLMGAVLVLFSGSSFFFLDSFTASHLISFKGWGLAEGERWPINAALSYILTGITWVNIPLVIAFGVLLEQVAIGLIQRFRLVSILLVSILFSGFYLISELFLAVLLVSLLPYLLYACYRQGQLLQAFGVTSVVSIFLFIGVYFSGGIIGAVLKDKVECIIRSGCPVSIQASEVSSSPVAIVKESVNLQQSASSLIEFRPMNLWGYPSEKRILVIWDRPWYYVRTLLLESVIVLLLVYAAYKKIYLWKDHPVLFSILAIGLSGPFFFSTVFGNLNFSKLTTASLVLLHLFIFYLIARLSLRKWFVGVLIVFLFLGSISGLLIGSNIQWQWISNKGKSQFCSQNPVCTEKK